MTKEPLRAIEIQLISFFDLSLDHLNKYYPEKICVMFRKQKGEFIPLIKILLCNKILDFNKNILT